MKKFVYPAVLYLDSELNQYSLVFQDLDIVSSGDSIEEAFSFGSDNLQNYFELAEKFDSYVVAPTNFNDTAKLNPKKSILLAQAIVKKSNKKLSDDELRYRDFVKKLFE